MFANVRIIIALLLGTHPSVIFSLQCRSYGKQVGECVDISRCPPFLAIILSNEKTSEDIRMLQKLTCITQSDPNKEPVVCCPLTEIVSASYLENLSPPTPAPSRTEGSATTPFTLLGDNRRRGPIIITPAPAPKTSSTPSPSHHHNRRPQQGHRPPQQQQNGQTEISPEELHERFKKYMPSLSECSQSDVFGGRIIGGKNAQHGEYPWMARLGYRNLRNGKVDYYCGGVIINKRYILTAAHCTYEYDENFVLVHVRLGEHNTKELTDCSLELNSCSVPENIEVEKVITHPEYNTVTKNNDIALVRLGKDIGFQTYFMKPVCLPFFKEYGLREFNLFEPQTQNTGIVSGWGRTNWTRSEGSTILQFVHLPIVSREKCLKAFRNRIQISSGQFCAGSERGQDSCGGDSGGPLMVDIEVGQKRGIPLKKKFQFGIVSFGPVKCGIGIPGVYTKTTEYLSWILKSIEP